MVVRPRQRIVLPLPTPIRMILWRSFSYQLNIHVFRQNFCYSVSAIILGEGMKEVIEHGFARTKFLFAGGTFFHCRM